MENQKLIIYGVWGLLGHEHEYCFSEREPVEENFDVFEVTLPEEFETYTSVMDTQIIVTPGGDNLEVHEAFRPGREPGFITLENSSGTSRRKVKFRKLNEKMRYNARYL